MQIIQRQNYNRGQQQKCLTFRSSALLRHSLVGVQAGGKFVIANIKIPDSHSKHGSIEVNFFIGTLELSSKKVDCLHTYHKRLGHRSCLLH